MARQMSDFSVCTPRWLWKSCFNGCFSALVPDSPMGCSQRPWRQGSESQLRGQETAAAVLLGTECLQVCHFLFPKEKNFYRTRAGWRRGQINWPEIFLDWHPLYLSISVYLYVCLFALVPVSIIHRPYNPPEVKICCVTLPRIKKSCTFYNQYRKNHKQIEI